MKSKNLSFATLLLLTASLVGGCSCGKNDNENVNNLVIKVGDKEYSAEDYYNQLLKGNENPEEAFKKMLRAVVESSMETSDNIKSAAELAVESLETEAANNAKANGTKKADELKTLLEDKGYESTDEMKADIIYEQKLSRLTDNYWEENKETYYKSFVEDRLPYLIRHVLVKVDDSTNANKIANNQSISSSEAKKLYDVIERFKNGDKFSYIANQESEDTGSTATGGAYYMDLTYSANGFVDEFVYGTYAMDTFATRHVADDDDKTVSYTFGANNDKLAKLTGLDTQAFTTYYENGFNFVDMSVVSMLGDVYNKTSSSNKDYFSIAAYNKEEDPDTHEVSYNATSDNLNSTENYYARSIIFNQLFNKPGISVIGYNTKAEADAAGAKYYVELKLSDSESKYILTDENHNPIYFVAARGSNNEIWVHFMTINVSALDDLENAKKFFKLGTDDEDNYTNYVELMNIAGTAKNANTLISTLESYVKSYATKGIGNSNGDESILTYDMVEYYMKENNITVNDARYNKVLDYIKEKKALAQTGLVNKLTEDWKGHTDKLAASKSDLVVKGVKPLECAVIVDADITERLNPYEALSTSDYLCRYVYGEGYEVQLSYYYETTNTGSSNDSFQKVSTSTSNRLWFDDTSNYTQWLKIDDSNSHVVLPTPKVADGYVFRGWYTDKNLTNKVEYVDLSSTSMGNHTIFFADVVQISATTINYTYVYSDGTAVNSDVASDLSNGNTNVNSKTYEALGDNEITFDTAAVASSYVTATGFLDKDGNPITSITLTEDDYGQTINVQVVVSPKATNVVYKYVDENGNDASASATATHTDVDSLTYSLTGSNEFAASTSEFTFSDGTIEAKSFKYARNETTTFAEAESTFTLQETDMGHTIYVYVVVGNE